MAISKEEQRRDRHRVIRQAIGLAVVLLVLVGISTMLGWLFVGVHTALDDTDKKLEYEDRVYSLVMFDQLPFEDAARLDEGIIKQAGIWGLVYQIQKNGGSLEDYERDETTGCVLLPRLEVDAVIAELFGPDCEVSAGSFETNEMNYRYDEERQAYLLPVTGSVALYTPLVDKISRHSGKTYVTVGYVPTAINTSSLTLTAPTEPTKYLEYVFSRGANRKWYLTAVEESKKQAPVSTAPAEDPATVIIDPQALVESNVDSSVLEGNADEPPTEYSEQGEEAPEGGEEAPVEEVPPQ